MLSLPTWRESISLSIHQIFIQFIVFMVTYNAHGKSTLRELRAQQDHLMATKRRRLSDDQSLPGTGASVGGRIYPPQTLQTVCMRSKQVPTSVSYSLRVESIPSVRF